MPQIADTQDIVIHRKRVWMKRAFDLVFATIAFVLLSPLFCFGSLLAKLQSKGPVFYKAKRVGKDAVPFEMYKFRTMVINADTLGGSLTTYRDTRITPIGRFLRWTKLDELPNLINVIKGEMSLIGPRPEAPDYVKYYTVGQKQVLQVKPGMTGPSQLANRDEEEKLKGQQDAGTLLHHRTHARKARFGSPVHRDAEHHLRHRMVIKNPLGRHSQAINLHLFPGKVVA